MNRSWDRPRPKYAAVLTLASLALAAGCGGSSEPASTSPPQAEGSVRPGDARAKAADACAAAVKAHSAARSVFETYRHGREPSEAELDEATDLILDTQRLAAEALALDEDWGVFSALARGLGVYDRLSSQYAFRQLFKACWKAGLLSTEPTARL